MSYLYPPPRQVWLGSKIAVKVIAEQIGHVHPVQVEQEIVRSISDANLVIDTTGSPYVNRWVNKIAFEVKTSASFASVTNGG